MKILFVCFGNTCRSPMAEGLARKMFEGQAVIKSAGTHAKNVGAAAPEAIEVMRSMFGIDITSHRPRNVKDVCVDDFDYIVAMDNCVANDLRRMYPSINARLVSWNIDDPISKGVKGYEKSAREIQKKVEKLPAYLKEKNQKK
jgi:protein-tyrosine phosphatase